MLSFCTGKPVDHESPDAPRDVPGQRALLRLADRFGKDAAFRRERLERSLVNWQNGYARSRLAHYTPDDWGRLPVAAFKTRPIRPSDIGKPIPTPDAAWTSVPSGSFPASPEGLKRRGEQMFTRFPAQVERAMISVLRKEDGPARYGLWETDDSVGGLVWIALPGGVYPALTCASCHASVDERGALLYGVPNHRIDLGKARDDYTGTMSLYSTWGRGRVDIAADGKDNPVVIADVRVARYQRYLHRTANIRSSLEALALRLETGLIVAHRKVVRPDRKAAFSLAYYLWTLGDKFDPERSLRHSGRPVFERHCASCHQGPSHSGKPIPPAVIDSPVAKMGGAARGTGKVRIPSLLGVSDRKRLLFGGEAAGIDGLLDPGRQEGGHFVGASLSAGERSAIRDYLSEL